MGLGSISMGIELRSDTPEDTRAIGEAIASLLRAGDAVALTGELGAGKTTLVNGLATGLGYTGPVASPTFTLVREYRGGRLAVLHVDVYRLERVQDVLDLGLDDALAEGEAVLAVEWGDAVEALLPPGHLVVELLISGPDERRAIAIRPIGTNWRDRIERLEQVLERWEAG
jgi:tRNA threonylcarbamoyladenosine biosynthesis protein TsaE